MDVEICNHVWNYSRCLSYMLSGLILDPPKCSVQVTIFFNDEDTRTVNAMTALHTKLPPNVCLIPRHLPKNKLFQRAIGRNEACLGTLASEIILCSDCDYVWSGTALDEILANYAERPLTFPNLYMKQKSHELGDECLALQETPQVLGLDPETFEECRFSVAIGGCHIIKSDIARKHGYLDGTRWMTPYRGDHFSCCRSDKVYRGVLGDLGYKFERFDGGMPWRIRHSKRGREHHNCQN